MLFFPPFLYPLTFGCSDILYTCGMVCLIPCFYLLADLFLLLYYVHVFEFGARSMAPLSFGNLFFFFFFIYCVHAFEFRVRSMTPLSFGSFFFYLLAIFAFILLYCVHAYQNQCYMCTKISVIQWLASSGKLVPKKNSCNLDRVQIKHSILETTCWDFRPKCWELKFIT